MIHDIVLFVDDEINILRALKRSLKKEEFFPLFVENGKSALDIMKVNMVKVIVVDIGLKDMNGIEVLKQVQANYPQVCKIALTGLNDLDEVVKIFDSVNLFRYITKPWDTDKLILTINEALIH